MPDTDSEDLPSLEEMRDTLTFMWDYFFQQMIDEALKVPGAGFEAIWNAARVQMRYRTLTAANGEASDFVELKIDAQDGSFAARGTFHAERAHPGRRVDNSRGRHCVWVDQDALAADGDGLR